MARRVDTRRQTADTATVDRNGHLLCTTSRARAPLISGQRYDSVCVPRQPVLTLFDTAMAIVEIM